MLAVVEVRNRQGELLKLPLEDVDNGIIVAEITGLDPTKATLVTSGIAGKDGLFHHESKREARDLVFKLEMDPDYSEQTVKSIRDRLYKFFMPKSEVKLRMVDAIGSYVDIVGIVEDFNAPYFSKDPVADLNIRCMDPDFIDPNPFTTSGFTVTGSDLTMTNIGYLGSVDSGFLFVMNFDRAESSFDIVHLSPDGKTYTMGVAYAFLPGDELTISTISGSKGVMLKRSGVVTSPLYIIEPQAKWLELQQGSNSIRVSASAAGIPWNIQYVNRYGGL